MVVGIWQIFLILIIVLILFGSGRLPQVMADVGRGLGNLRRALDGNSVGGIGGEQNKEGVRCPEGSAKDDV